MCNNEITYSSSSATLTGRFKPSIKPKHLVRSGNRVSINELYCWHLAGVDGQEILDIWRLLRTERRVSRAYWRSLAQTAGVMENICCRLHPAIVELIQWSRSARPPAASRDLRASCGAPYGLTSDHEMGDEFHKLSNGTNRLSKVCTSIPMVVMNAQSFPMLRKWVHGLLLRGFPAR